MKKKNIMIEALYETIHKQEKEIKELKDATKQWKNLHD